MGGNNSYLPRRRSSRTYGTLPGVKQGYRGFLLILRVDINICWLVYILPQQYNSTMPSSKHNRLPDTRTPVYIDILPESSAWSSSFSSHSRGPSSSLYKSPQGAISFHPSSNTPRRMRDIDPTVTFVSTSVVNAKSSYIVLLDGAPIHSEDTKLECIGPYFTGSNRSMNPSDEGPLLYSTALVPKYWEILCESPDPTIYTIIHDVYRPVKPAPCVPKCLGRPPPVLIFSATYHFRYSVLECTPPPCTTPSYAYHANPPFIANTAHAYYDFPNCSQNHPLPPSPSDQGSLQSHEDGSQNSLYEPFTLDVSLGDDDSPGATSKVIMSQSSVLSFPKDIRDYYIM